MNVQVRMINGDVVALRDFGRRDPAAVSHEEMAFAKAASDCLGPVPGGFFFGIELTTGRPQIIVAANVAKIMLIE